MKIILLFIVAYLLGSIPSGLWIGKFFFHIDLRKHGSGNMGTTNTFRVLGKKAGFVVFILDVAKGTIATLLPTFFHITTINPLWFGVCAIIGHTFPIFAHFKGGKAVATSAGMLLGYAPHFFLVAFLLFITIIYLTSMVSVASILCMIMVSIGSFIFPKYVPWILPHFNSLFSTIAIVLTIFIIYRHRDNIKRIMNGTENKVSFGLGYKKEKKKS
ncbi:glycerol-3-phosphate 1-O-acyltransferase PlsY [Catellicoccus marimammalium]|uniref:Glycerol-3-phosphate acyltransferase n=1 Tax=Catellicoccus marimammalium M35/04/3 TaxID=1234409 RepID=K8Z9W9_9ENTE|nr:glycerol-3-phosphate 1-O-acyltransferase PlsY [Catellicoccus marimammalium]EKU27695.1 Acyl-phosphate:glycerol-3-phosphate O-acyltransferase PlsY [Catellicoccus marimammalium M35/04/3]